MPGAENRVTIVIDGQNDALHAFAEAIAEADALKAAAEDAASAEEDMNNEADKGSGIFSKLSGVVGGILKGALSGLATTMGELPGIFGQIASAGNGLGAVLLLAAGAAVALTVVGLFPLLAALALVATGVGAFAFAWVHDFGQAVAKSAPAIHQLHEGLNDLFRAVQPQVNQALRTMVDILNTALPSIIPLAKEAGKAFDGLLKSIERWLKSPSGQEFLHWMRVEGPQAIKTFTNDLKQAIFTIGSIFDTLYHLGQTIDKDWHTVWHDIGSVVGPVVHTVAAGIDQLRHWFSNMGNWLHTANTDWNNFSHQASADVKNWAHDVASNFDLVRGYIATLASNVARFFTSTIPHDLTVAVNFFRQLPAQIGAALSSLPGILFRAGVNAMNGLISGLRSMLGSLMSTVASIAGAIAGHFGLSPAIYGPLSGGGAPYIRGQHFAADFAAGMLSGRGGIVNAAAALAGGAGMGAGAAGAGAGGGGKVTLEIAGGGQAGFDQFMLTWFRNQVRVKGGGNVQKAFGRT